MAFTAGMREALRAAQRVIGWPELDFRGKLFAVSAITGFFVSVTAATADAINGLDWMQLVLNLAVALFSAGLLWVVRVTRRTRLAYVIAVVGIFMVAFPMLFFTGGGYTAGMPAFFVFAIVVTALMIDGAALWVLGSLLVVLYTLCCLAAYWHPELVTPLPSESAVVSDVIISVLISGGAIAVALHLLLQLHERNQELLAERNQQLSEVDRAKSDFLAVVAHELNTPLAAIRSHAEEAERNVTAGAPVSRELSVIESEAERLGRLVGQLLDVARIADGRLDLELRPEFLAAIVQQTLRAYIPLCTRAGNTLELARGSASPVVVADRERVAQVLVNLLANAARHTRQGAITVGVTERDGFAEVFVRDTGEGMPAEVVERLFEPSPGYPAGGLRSARDAGLGLGLQISRHIVEAHGGAITVASTPGLGTTVTCSFPLATVGGPS
jgi:signal transduction histidine kinase